MKWTIEQLLQELKRLLKPDVIGFYESFEVTEIIGFQKDGPAMNFLSLFVAEPGQAPAGAVKPEFLTSERIELRGTDYKFGVVRFRITLQFLIDTLERFAKTGDWQTGQKPLKVGRLAPVVPQFVHPDFNDPHPWNAVLKNNFFEGSHVLELFDTTKDAARFLLSDSRLLTDLAKQVRSVVLMDIDGLSDRLGNIVIQLPVTVITTGVRGSEVGDQGIRLAWHEKATPRPLRVSGEIYNDSTVDAFDSKEVGVPPIAPDANALKMRSPGGGARTYIWDDSNQVLLSASPVQTFLLMAAISMHATSIDDPGEPKREFTIPMKGTAPQHEKVPLKRVEKPYFFGSRPEQPREPWRTERIFKVSARQLLEQKEFVQYGQFTGLGRKEALDDIRWLIEKHGTFGAWLWDPFLKSDDVLQTLFFSPHRNADLRALSNGNRIESPEDDDEDDAPAQTPAASWGTSAPGRGRWGSCLARLVGRASSAASAPVDKSAIWLKDQREVLEANCGNREALKLEFRLRRRGAGWKFHDRFLIFPQQEGRALAWSLGTSVNSLGTSHHILQKVSNPELVQNAFLTLWERLDDARFKVWESN